MQICQSLIGGKPVTSPLHAIDKIYPATGEIVAKIEPATQEMLDEAVAVAAFAQASARGLPCCALVSPAPRRTDSVPSVL